MKPRYDQTPNALLTRHGQQLAACVGQVMSGAWLAWDRREDRWLPDEAVVFCIGDDCLAVNCWKLTDIALGWNCIDLRATPAWVATWGTDFDLVWRENPLPLLRDAAGQRVREVNVLEYLHRTTVVRAPGNPAIVGQTSESWLLHGLEFVLEEATLTIFNALDENGLTLNISEGTDFRRTSAQRAA